MSRTIWKWELDLLDSQLVRFPRGARLLTVQMQRSSFGLSKPVLWAEVEPEAAVDTVDIAIYGTGWPLPENPGEYLGTVQDTAGGIGLVWHVYARRLDAIGVPMVRHTHTNPAPVGAAMATMELECTE